MAMHLWAVADAAASKAASPARPDAVGYAAGLLTWLIAGTVFVAVKAVSGEMPPWTLCCARSCISALVLVPLVAGHHSEMIAFARRRWKEAALIGALGLGLTQGVMFTALSYTSAVNTGIVFALTPMITMLLARLLIHEPMNGWQALGSAIAFCGIVVVAVQGSPQRLRVLELGIGDLIALGSTVMFASYTVLLRRARFELPRMPLLVVLLVAGTAASFPFALLEYWSGAHDHLAARGYLALLYTGIVGGAVMYLLYNASIDFLGASRAGALVYTQMIFVAFFAWLILGEALEWYHFVGAGFVIAGVLLVTLLRPKPAPGAAA
jgi:drug/metabolite transporter (DMT)-like permease